MFDTNAGTGPGIFPLRVITAASGAIMKFRDLKLRIRALRAPRRAERELDEELSFHIERETQKLVGGGLRPSMTNTTRSSRAAARR